MTVWLGILVALISSGIFYWFLSFTDEKRKTKKFELQLIDEKLKIKLKKEMQIKFIKWVRIYYSGLFFLASLIAFYERSIILVSVYSLIVFTVGLLLAYYLLIFYARRSKK